jgi:hypothetical protein
MRSAYATVIKLMEDDPHGFRQQEETAHHHAGFRHEATGIEVFYAGERWWVKGVLYSSWLDRIRLTVAAERLEAELMARRVRPWMPHNELRLVSSGPARLPAVASAGGGSSWLDDV